MWKCNSDEDKKIKEFLQYAKKSGVDIEDYRIVKKDGKLHAIYTRRDTGGKLYTYEICKYA